MQEITKSYYAIIPANVRYDKELTPNAKLLYGEITALCNEKGYCWAGNEYFSQLYGVSKVSISKWVNQLKEKGYINSKIIYREGTKHILNRYLTILNGPIKEKLMTSQRKVNEPIKEKFKDNNTSNTTMNNIYYNDFIKNIYKSWIDNNLTNHKEVVLEANIKKKHTEILKLFTVDEIKEIIKVYSEVLISDNYYFTHKYTFWTFLQRGYLNFLPESDPKSSFLKNQNEASNIHKLSREDRIKRIENL